VDVRAVVSAGIARLGRLGELLEHGTPQERKIVVQAFLARMEISPREGKGSAYFAALPVGVGTLSFRMVAGAGFETDGRLAAPSHSAGQMTQSPGQDLAQVGPRQQVAEGGASKRRTEAELTRTNPGLDQSTTGAQRDGLWIEQIAIIAEAWPRLPNRIQEAVLVIVCAVTDHTGEG